MLLGNMTSTLLPDILPVGFDVRLCDVFFRFHAGSQIAVLAQTTYPGGIGSQLALDLPHVRTIVGGTGRYFGALGQVTSVRHPDGTYSHKLVFVVPNVDPTGLF